jgi:hypothetical protein
MRACTIENIKSMCKEQPALKKILRYMIGTADGLTSEDIAEGAGLSIIETEKILAFVAETCRLEDFKNPIGVSH